MPAPRTVRLLGPCAVLTGALLASLAAERADAQPEHDLVDLSWDAPSECPSHEAVLSEIARVLGGSRRPRDRATARAQISRDVQGRWHGVLSVDARAAHDERTLEAESCDALASATALIVAVAIEGGVPPVSAASPGVEPVSPVAQAAPRPAPARATAPHVSQLVVAADVILDVGTMPAADPGGEGALGWAYHVAPWRVRALLSGALFVPIDKSATGHQGLFTLYSGTGRACVSIGPGVLDIGPCLGMAFEDITGSGRGAPQVADRSGTRVALVGSVLASWRFSPNASLFARADGLIPLHSPAFVWLESTGPRLVYQPAPGAARGAIGVELRFF